MADGAEDFNVVPNKRAKADVWKHFGLKKRKKDSMVVEGVAACLRCDAEIRCTGGGTSNMGTHIRRHHPDTSTTASPVPKSTTGLSNQPSIKDKMCQINQPPYPASSPKAINITHKIALWIAHDMIPFRMVDSPYLRDVIESLNPRYQVPSRKQFSETSIPGMYEVEKRKVQASLKEAEQVMQSE